MPSSISPKAWREAMKLSMLAAGRLAGHVGRNPSRVWQRWETGEQEPRATVIEVIEKASNGQVTAASWAAARREYLARTGEPSSKRIAAQEQARFQAA